MFWKQMTVKTLVYTVKVLCCAVLILGVLFLFLGCVIPATIVLSRIRNYSLFKKSKQ